MSFALIELVMQAEFTDGVTRAIAIQLANWANEDGGNIHPSIKTLAKHTLFTPRCIQQHLRKLEQTNVIRKTRAGGIKETSMWEFTPDWIDQQHQRIAARKQTKQPNREPIKPPQENHITPERKKQLWTAPNWQPEPRKGLHHINTTTDAILAEMQDGPAKHTFLAMLNNIRKKETTT